jgi:hypothetical protein
VIAPFDIFRAEDEKTVVWLGTAADLETAKNQVEALMKTRPGEYLIRSLKTGNKISMKPSNGSGATHDSPATTDGQPGLGKAAR